MNDRRIERPKEKKKKKKIIAREDPFYLTILPNPRHNGHKSSSKKKETLPEPLHSPQRTPPSLGSPGLTIIGGAVLGAMGPPNGGANEVVVIVGGFGGAIANGEAKFDGLLYHPDDPQDE